MPSNYEAIRKYNLRWYGEGVSEWAPPVLSNRYDGHTHFIFEVLQNAEDALKKRGEWEGKRSVHFSLDSEALTVSHFGKPFDEADVIGVCGIAKSTKEYTDIGRFGIGFKSVYAFTDTPEIHSGEEHFAIDTYVLPRAAKKISPAPEETRIYIPFKAGEPSAKENVLEGLQCLGPRTLLFLRAIEEVSWSVDGKAYGRYHRSSEVVPFNGARKVRVVGRDDVSDDITEEWLVFSREVFHEGKSIGYVEVAFRLNGIGENPSVQSVNDSKLVVFFPTVVSTHLGFLVQGPYLTTPSRDNVPEKDDWNRHLVQETAVLLTDALKGLQKIGLLDVSALRSLPLSAVLFNANSQFAPFFQAVKETLVKEAMLPGHRRKYIAGQNAKLAGSRELRELISDKQLAALFPDDSKPAWLSGEITPNLTPDLYRYLTGELGIVEIDPAGLIRRLNQEFLEAQSDSWIGRLYEFLNGQRARNIQQLLPNIPLVRLEDGSHTRAFVDREPQAYLPGNRTDFPTVRESVCELPAALEFLRSVGLHVPDPVDDVRKNLLPKYAESPVALPESDYEADIRRIVAAYSTDSDAQRSKLVADLRETKFVAAVDAGTGISQLVTPREAYIPTERLRNLFEGVNGVLLVDNSRGYLRGEEMRSLLRAVGTPEYLVPIRIEPSLTAEDKRELRRRFGDESISQEKSVEDYTLMGLVPLIETLSGLPSDLAYARASLLWEALCDVQTNRRNYAFYGRYHWLRYSARAMQFPARFVKTLNETAWIPDKDGKLQPPAYVVFQDTGWEKDPALEAKIQFKPAVIEELAKEAGIDPGALDFLRKHDISEAKLREVFGIKDDNVLIPTDRPLGEPDTSSSRAPATAPGSVSTPRPAATTGGGQSHTNDQAGSGAVNQPTGRREFVTYVKVVPDEADEDPDGLTYQARMSLEEKAIAFILSKEPSLQRTPANNPGFDLYEADPDGQEIRWVEVKAMSGTFDNRPATLTKTQFEFAQKRQNACWLYVVENAGDPAQSRIVKIQNPAGKAQTFTFDSGWVHLAE